MKRVESDWLSSLLKATTVIEEEIKEELSSLKLKAVETLEIILACQVGDEISDIVKLSGKYLEQEAIKSELWAIFKKKQELERQRRHQSEGSED